MTADENGTIRPKHERLIKAENSLVKLINKRCLFTYLDASLTCTCPATNNRIEGGVNAQLRTMLRNIPTWGDAIVWSDLHNYNRLFSNLWD